jgi:hypothetical protein
MTNDAERQRLAARAVEVNDRFGAERVLGQWETMLQQVALKKRGRRENRRSFPADVAGS